MKRWLLLGFAFYLASFMFIGEAEAGKKALLGQLNRYRIARLDVRPLTYDKHLSRHAKRWSEYMAVLGEVKDPPRTWMIRSLKHVPEWTIAGDSVACCWKVERKLVSTPKDILRAMWRHRAHRQILGSRKFDHVGIGIYRDDGGCVWLTFLLYGTPRHTLPELLAENDPSLGGL